MTKDLRTLAFALALAMSLEVGDVWAQAQPQAETPAPSQPAAQKKPNIPLQVHVVIARYQGEKRISSVPYTLSVKATAPPFDHPPSQLKMGSNVPIISARESTTGFPPNYQNIGTQIDCSAASTDDGRFELSVSVEDNSIYVDDQVVKGVSKGNEPPVFRSFRSRNQVILRDGQSTQFTAATDRISGEVIRIDVTVNVVK